MIYTHNINPVALALGPLAIRWYGLAYALSFLLAYLWLHYLAKNKRIVLSSQQVETLIFSVILGLIVGARMGYFLFYHLSNLLSDPLEIFRVWNGGMSFHGGLVGVVVALFYCSRKFKVSLLTLGDLLVAPGALGLAFGRIANFINGELWGRPTGGDWGVIFPRADELPRYPSQLFESAQNFLITLVLILTFQRKVKTGTLSFLFLFLYGLGRIINEQFWREPLDGYILGITKGQFWSVPLVVMGAAGLVWIYKKGLRLKV
jgi:phosphatidylglycerol:prolipoprotein diacylglycerol transferase